MGKSEAAGALLSRGEIAELARGESRMRWTRLGCVDLHHWHAPRYALNLLMRRQRLFPPLASRLARIRHENWIRAEFRKGRNPFAEP